MNQKNQDNLISTLKSLKKITIQSQDLFDKAYKEKKDAEPIFKVYKNIGTIIADIIAVLLFIWIVTYGNYSGYLQNNEVSFLFYSLISCILIALVLVKVFEYLSKFLVKKRTNAADNLIQKGNDLLQENKKKLEILDSKYWYPQAIDYIIKALVSKKATNLEEAIDFFNRYYAKKKEQSDMSNKKDLKIVAESKIFNEYFNK